MEYKGIAYLRNKLNMKRPRGCLRYDYYEMKNNVEDLGISTPPKLSWLKSTLGWCTKSVDALADRLRFREFKNDEFDMNGIYRLNNPDVLFNAAILEALIGSCSFIYISEDGEGFPRMQVLTCTDATGEIDPITNLLKEGYAVLERNSYGDAAIEAYFIPGKTYIYRLGKQYAEVYSNEAPYPLLVPIIYRPDSKRPFGHSRISRACMKIQDEACRTIKRSEIAAEFYSFPQKYVVGTDQELDLESWSASMSTLINISKDDDGDKPTFGQFQQQSMAPHTEQLKMFASAFASETGLTLDDMGFTTGNPSSADAIKYAHENLRLAAAKAQDYFGSCFLNAGYLAACVRDDFAYLREQVTLTIPTWEPIFEPDAAMLSGIGDGAIKINQAVPGYFGSDNLSELTGIAKSAEPVTVTETPNEQ